MLGSVMTPPKRSPIKKRPTTAITAASIVSTSDEPLRGFGCDTVEIHLLADADGVADTGDYYSIARFASLQNQALDSLDNFLSSVHYLLLHRRNCFLKALLDDNCVDGYLVESCFLFNLEPFRPDAAYRGADSFADLA